MLAQTFLFLFWVWIEIVTLDSRHACRLHFVAPCLHAGCMLFIFHLFQGPEHPHPGRRFTSRGFPRVGYLPDNDRGRKVSFCHFQVYIYCIWDMTGLSSCYLQTLCVPCLNKPEAEAKVIFKHNHSAFLHPLPWILNFFWFGKAARSKHCRGLQHHSWR